MVSNAQAHDVAIVALIAGQQARIAVTLIQKVVTGCVVLRLVFGQCDADPQSVRVAAKQKSGQETAAPTVKSLALGLAPRAGSAVRRRENGAVDHSHVADTRTLPAFPGCRPRGRCPPTPAATRLTRPISSSRGTAATSRSNSHIHTADPAKGMEDRAQHKPAVNTQPATLRQQRRQKWHEKNAAILIREQATNQA